MLSETDMERPPATVPTSMAIVIKGGYEYDSKDTLQVLKETLSLVVREISRFIDLSGVDGITVAFDQDKAIQYLDSEGDVPVKRKRNPLDNEISFRIASGQYIRRDGKLKTHLVFYHPTIRPIVGGKDAEGFELAIHTIVHECSHVEIASVFDKSFPDIILKHVEDWHDFDRKRWCFAIFHCWDEYAACYMSALVGANPLDGYVEVFTNALRRSAPKRMTIMKNCYIDKDWDKICDESFLLYGQLMKLACYVLGTMRRKKLTVEDVPLLKKALEGSWFASYFKRLGELCEKIMASYGKWEDLSSFEAIGDLFEEILADRGITITRLRDGGSWVNVDFPLAIRM